jgi:hypothetical protein
MWKKFSVALSILGGAKPSLAASVVVGAVVASSTGYHIDPIQAAICIGGMVVVTAYSKPETRLATAANLIISLFLGMIVAEPAAAYATAKLSAEIHPRLVAGILAGGWPWIVSFGGTFLKSKLDKGSA